MDPSGLMSLLDYALIGSWVHEYIGRHFVSGDPQHRFSNSASIGFIIMDYLNIDEGINELLRPDLVDTKEAIWDLYEIKPAGSVYPAAKQLGRYIDRLNLYGIDGWPGISYIPPATIPPPPFYWNLRINAWLDGPGIILYSIRGDAENQAVNIVAATQIIRILSQLSSSISQAGMADVQATIEVACMEEFALAI